jgi:hypothetical protein
MIPSLAAPSPDEVRRITQEVLARPEFRRTQTFTQYVMEHIFKWLRDIAEWSGANPGAYKVLIVVLTIVLVGLLAHIIYTVVHEFASYRERAAADNGRRSLRALEGVAENWTDAFRLARAALDGGDLYRALWITHRILLTVLDRMDRVKFARWKTNSDYLRECRGDDSLSKTLAEITAAYERVIYAHNDFDREQTAHFLSQVEALSNEAAR